MLEPDEIKHGMAYPDEYLLGTKREQVNRSGNAVTTPADIGYAVAEYLWAVKM